MERLKTGKQNYVGGEKKGPGGNIFGLEEQMKLGGQSVFKQRDLSTPEGS